MSSEVVINHYSFAALVRKADGNPNEKDPGYEFSNGRKFRDTPGYSQTFTIWDPDSNNRPQTFWDGAATDWDTR